ncbi:hypothetical protein ACFYWH_42110 [Streptomyces sp. NPDC003737]|uniref:hypothetical protein n=1 Tax=Streptomyces sp. NPDC003737 TaxID=3364685 RepID=UPI003691C8BC
MHSIPRGCARRPLAGGLVVPWVSLIHDGHAAFGSLDADQAAALEALALPALTAAAQHG